MKGQTKKEEFVDFIVKAFTMDHALSGLLNVVVYEHCGDDLEATPEAWLVVGTPKNSHYHEPAKHT